MKKYDTVENKEKEYDMEKKFEEETQIDLIGLFYALKKRALILAAALLAGAVIAGAYTKLTVTPMYSATSSILVLSKETTLTSIADLQLGSQLSQDYAVLFKTRTVMQKVIDELGLDMAYQQLENSITITYPNNTRIMEITVTNSDPETAKQLADKVAEVGAAYVEDQMEVAPPKIIEKAETPSAPYNTGVAKNVLFGAFAGLVLAGGVIVLITMMDDTVKTEEDIRNYLGVPALASIPDRRDYISSDRTKSKNQKKKRRRRRRK